MENKKGIEAKGDAIMKKEDFAALWKSIRLKVTDTYDVPPEILWVNGSTIGTLGNFSASTGKAKSKKTFNISAIVAAALTNDEVLHYSACLPPDKRKILYVDTEQSRYHCHKVMERIRAKYPDVLIQACASGGGRVEYGALKYFDEVWTSDNTEALSRARIQYGTSLFYPAVVMGSHVSATPNHQTGNITPIKFRFDMACAGRLGMELQPRQMTDEERQFARRAIASYKEYRDIVMQGDLYRIGTPYDKSGCYGLMYVSKDRKQAVLFTYSLRYQGRSLIPKFRLQGLDPKTGYTIRELNVDKSRNWFDGKTFSGEMLSNAGINPSMPKIYDSGVFLLTAE